MSVEITTDAEFQSRRGFSDRLDTVSVPVPLLAASFNPVVGFLTVSTPGTFKNSPNEDSFNPVVGFLTVSTSGYAVGGRVVRRVSIPSWVF